jgi:hypothetical protein
LKVAKEFTNKKYFIWKMKTSGLAETRIGDDFLETLVYADVEISKYLGNKRPGQKVACQHDSACILSTVQALIPHVLLGKF